MDLRLLLNQGIHHENYPVTGRTPQRTTRKAGISVLLSALVLLSACNADSRISTEQEALPALPYAQELQTALDRVLHLSPLNQKIGISAAIRLPGFQTWTGVSGYSHPETPISAEMLFDAGSVAKIFEAALALKLAEEGVIDLDHPIQNWLPEYPNVDGRITMRQLLNHSSGVFNVFEHPDFPWVDPNVDYTRNWSMTEVFSNFVLEPYGLPGSLQHYSSTNYRLITEILEIAGGTAVSKQIESYFLEPLNLEQTMMIEEGVPSGQLVIAHPWVDLDRDGELEDLYGIPVTWKVTLTHPVLYTTAEDLTRWMQSLFYDRSVLAQSSLDEMLTFPEVAVPDPEGSTYGLGIIDLTDVLSVQAIGHGGSALGYSTAALYLPEFDMAIAWLINTGESPSEVAGEIMWNTWSALSEVLLLHLKSDA